MRTLVFRWSAPRLLAVAAGIFLLGLNVAGALRPARDPALRPELALFRSNLSVSPDVALRALPRRAGEPDTVYVERMTALLHRTMAHYWPAESGGPVSARVSARENFLLWAAALVRPDVFGRHEYFDPERAVARGFGLCSQFSVALHALLRREGIPARYVGLKGHVVVEVVPAAGRPRIADPDFGVVVPHPLAEIERRPAIVRPYYAAVLARDLRPAVGPDDALMAELYGPEGNQAFASPDEEASGKRVLVHLAERLAYAGKWALPLVLVCFCLSAAKVPAAARRPARRRSPGITDVVPDLASAAAPRERAPAALVSTAGAKAPASARARALAQ